jgi:hypothetical protein
MLLEKRRGEGEEKNSPPGGDEVLREALERSVPSSWICNHLE